MKTNHFCLIDLLLILQVGLLIGIVFQNRINNKHVIREIKNPVTFVVDDNIRNNPSPKEIYFDDFWEIWLLAKGIDIYTYETVWEEELTELYLNDAEEVYHNNWSWR